MKCRQCGWATSLVDRDLFSGRCAICEKLHRSRSGRVREVLAAEARFKHAAEKAIENRLLGLVGLGIGIAVVLLCLGAVLVTNRIYFWGFAVGGGCILLAV